MKIRDATAQYEAWLGRQLTLVEPDLAVKHREMRAAVFLSQATFSRWVRPPASLRIVLASS
ncbi:MAG: hypothetical protein ABI647_01715 [Gemmatimonadota bacterium]